jgi:hypothetical protein
MRPNRAQQYIIQLINLIFESELIKCSPFMDKQYLYLDIFSFFKNKNKLISCILKIENFSISKKNIYKIDSFYFQKEFSMRDFFSF